MDLWFKPAEHHCLSVFVTTFYIYIFCCNTTFLWLCKKVNLQLRFVNLKCSCLMEIIHQLTAIFAKVMLKNFYSYQALTEILPFFEGRSK